MKKLPKIYQGDFDKEINNNKEVDYVSNSKEKDITPNVFSTIDKLFSSTRHTFNIPVIIKTKDKEYNTKIAGRIKDYIITLDNDVIFIKDIISIIEK